MLKLNRSRFGFCLPADQAIAKFGDRSSEFGNSNIFSY